MIDIKKIDNTVVFNEMLKKVSFKFPVAEISSKTGYSKGSISEILKGKRSPTDEFLKKFSKSFDIEIPEVKYKEQIETINYTSEHTEPYGLKNDNKKPPSQKENENDVSTVDRVLKLLESAYAEIKELRQENDRLKNI